MELNLDAVLVTMVSLTMGVTQVYKMLLPSGKSEKLFFKLLDKSSPLFALLVGVGLSLLYNMGFNYQALESGLVVGLVAAGVYSGGKTILNKK